MRYENYKDSGIEWIGEVPSHWCVCKIKHRYSFHTGSTPSSGRKDFYEGDLKWANISDINGGILYDTAKHITKEAVDSCSMEISPKGSLLYSFKLSIGQVAFCGEDMYTNEAIATFKQGKQPLKYLYFIAPQFIVHNANYNIYDAPLLNQDLIKNAIIVLPSTYEQQAIATYLDEKCGEINRAIGVQKKKIDLLNELKQTIITDAVTKGLDPNATMKDSGVEWIGEIPEHWEVMKLNFACKKVTDFVASGSFADLRKNVTYLDEPDYAMLVRTADLSGKDKATAKVYVSKHSYKFLSNSNLFGGEVILPNIGASIGDVYIVPEHIYEKATLGPNSIMLISKTDNHFLYYLFRSKRWREALIILGQAAAQGKFNKTEVRGLKVIIPPITKQQAIVAHIEKKVSKIDLQISRANRRIELLEELKQSIITEAVTGKIKVC